MGLERTAAPQPQEQQQQLTFTDFIQGIASKAGLNIEIRNPELVVVPWDFGQGRMQQTYVRVLGTTGAGNLIIGFFSPALKMPPNQLLNQKTSNDLLRKNSTIPHGAWSIVRVDGDDYLGVLETHIAQTMQPEEFHSAAVAVAKLADDMEKTLGADVF